MSWQHTLIPALPFSKRGFLDAPTPYLMGLLLNPNIESNINRNTPSTPRKKKLSFGESFVRSLSSHHLPDSKKGTDQAFDRILPPSSSYNSASNGRPTSGSGLRSGSNDWVMIDGEQCEEIKFWQMFLNGTYELESDSLVIHLDRSGNNKTQNAPTAATQKQQIGQSRASNYSNTASFLRKPTDGGLTSLPKSVYDILKLRFTLLEKSTLSLSTVNEDEEAQGKFIIISETFLQMYNKIFGSLQNYLNDDGIWNIKPVNGENGFDDKIGLEHYFNVRY